MKSKLIGLTLLLSLVLTSGFGCKLVSQDVQQKMQPVTINYWRVWDGPDAFEEIINEYKKIHTNVTINYKKFRYDEYEKELLNALAEDRGPDIFSIHNTWIKKYQSKIVPMPATITLAYPVVRGNLKKEVIPELRTVKSLSLKDLKNNYVDVVYSDVVMNAKDDKTGVTKEQIVALPLSVDTLAMFYNKDLLNNAGVSVPPTYWNREFQQNVKKMTKQDKQGLVVQSGIALGGSQNIERYSDIISVLMMQNGAEMTDASDKVTFDLIPATIKDKNYSPGVEALRFYSDFANPAMEVYSWNKTLDNSINMFAQGKVAIIFGYAYHLPTIKALAPKLNFGVAKLPQIQGNPQTINFANYWVETVSSKSKASNEAWDFIQFATKAENAKTYLKNTKKPTALRALVNEQVDDMDIGIFAEQVLTAKSWYKGYDSNAAERIMGEMIDNAIDAGEKIGEVLHIGASKINQTMEKPNN